MSEDHKLIVTGVKWNYLHSHEIPAIGPPTKKGAPKAIVAYCRQCETIFNAGEGSGPNKFLVATGAIHLKHACGIEEVFSTALLQTAH
jgi:hypothetical protein